MSDAASSAVDEDDDPIVASYSVFLKPALPKRRKLFVLQYPNAFAGDTRSLRPPEVSEMRIKPETGIVEVDLPIDTSGGQYDRLKGKSWGAALKKTVAAKDGGSLGLAGGFGIGAPPVRAAARRGQAANGGDNDPASMPWSEALRQDLPLRIKTLGGRAVDEPDTRYMIAVFSGKNIHLTPVTSLVALRPNLQHLDATTELDRANRSSAAGAAGAGAKEGGPARAIHMTLKAAMDDDGVSTETIADRLKAVQTEPWRRLQYVHDEAADAWEAYNESLVLNPSTDVVGRASKDDVSKGKEVAKDDAAQADEGAASAPDLVEKVPRLEGSWGEEDLLRAVSGFTTAEVRPGEEVAFAAAKASAPLSGAAGDRSGKGKGKEVALMAEKADKAKPRPGRHAEAATAGTAKTGSRAAKANANSACTAMETD